MHDENKKDIAAVLFPTVKLGLLRDAASRIREAWTSSTP